MLCLNASLNYSSKPASDYRSRKTTRHNYLLVSGRFGLRSGEITHFMKEWIDQDRDLIRIPQSESCDCGYFREQAKREAANNNLTFKQAMTDRWHPKTENSSHVIPFDVSLRVELCIDRFPDRYEAFPKSRSTINQRVSEAADEAGLTGRVYPHCLRATAASFHAYQGVPPVPLQAMMGWNDRSTAQKYLRISGAATAKAIRNVHH